MVARVPFVLALLASSIVVQPGLAAPVADTRSRAMEARLFPVLEAIDPGRLEAGARSVLTIRRTRIDACRREARCVLSASLWTEAERGVLSLAAEKALTQGGGVRTDDGTAAQAARELAGLNAVLQVYGQGLPARNPLIDGPAYQPGGIGFANRAAWAVSIAATGEAGDGLDPSIDLALSLLDVNDRDEAIAFEPLDERYNAAARTRARTLDWSAYRYTAIVLPGNGPELDGETLTPRAKFRVRLAAARFADKVAPFIIVSGGAVHPRGTQVVEAVEMRKALIERYGVPEDRIILEPYARLTATNLRNAVRRLKALGAPLDRQALVISDADHIATMVSAPFAIRAAAQLGYQPGKIEPLGSDTELAFLPSEASLRVDPLDPADP